MNIIRFYILFAIVLKNIVISMETLCISNLTDCDGYCPQPNIHLNFFFALNYIDTQNQLKTQNTDFQIIFCDQIHILDQELLMNGTGENSFDETLKVYTFFSTFSNLNLMMRSKNNLFNAELILRTNNFTIFVGKSLQLSNFDVYGNDMLFQELNTNEKCNNTQSLCCQNSDILNESSTECSFVNGILVENNQNSGLALFMSNGNQKIEISIANITLNAFIAFSGLQIKFTSFINVAKSNEMSLYIENVIADTCFFELSFIYAGDFKNGIYYLTNFKIINYNFVHKFNDSHQGKPYFFQINGALNAILKNLEIENSEKILSIMNNPNISLINVSIDSLSITLEDGSNFIYANNSSLEINYIQLSNMSLLQTGFQKCSFLFLNQNNQITLNYFEINDVIFINEGFNVINVYGENNILSINEGYFNNLMGNGIFILLIDQNQQIEITHLNFFNVSIVLFQINESSSNNFIQINNSYFNCSSGGILIVSGINNTLEIKRSLFINNSALENAALGLFQNSNQISFVECKIILQASNLVVNAFSLNNLKIFQIISCFVLSGPINLIQATGVSNLFSDNNTIVKCPGTMFYEFYLDNVTNFLITNTTVQGKLVGGNTYYPMFSLYAVSNLLIQDCSFFDLNILFDKFGSFYITNYLLVQNSIFQNMLSWTYDNGYLIQSTAYNTNTNIFNCSFYNLSSNNQSQLLFFESNAFLQISKCIFNSTYSSNQLGIDPSQNINGAGLLFSMFNDYIIIDENIIDKCIGNDSLWGLFQFVSSTIIMKNNIFTIDNVLVGSIFFMSFTNEMLFHDNLIFVENLNQIYQTSNYSFFSLSIQNSILMENITFDFNMLSINQNTEIFSGFILDANLNNQIFIKNIDFASKAQVTQWIMGLFALNQNNEIFFLSCSFDNDFVSPFLFSNTNNIILMNQSILQKFYDGIIFSESNDQIIIQNIQISLSLGDSQPFFNLNFLTNISFTNTSIENCQSSSSPLMFAYDSNIIILINSSFNSFITYGNGGVLYLAMNNQIYISSVNAMNITSLTGGFSYLQNNNNMLILMSTFSKITSSNSGGCFNLLANNSLEIFDSKFNGTSSMTYAGFLISFSQNIIKITESIIINSKAISNSAGLVYLVFNSSLQILSSYLDDISAENESGGLLKGDDVNIILIQNCSLNNFNALKGGTIFLESSNIMLISNVSFVNSSAELYGGCINIDYKNQIKIFNCSLNFAQSNLDGGFFYATSENTIYFENNSLNFATSLNGMGGGIYLDYNNILILQEIYMNNSFCDLQGSFLYLRNNNSFKAEGVKIQNSGNLDFSNYQETSLIVSNLNNFLIMKNIRFFGNLSCGNVFLVNNSKLKIQDFKINHIENLIISIIFLENSYFVGHRLSIFNDYSSVFYSLSSFLNISDFRKISSKTRNFNQTYFFFLNSEAHLKDFSFTLQYTTRGNNNTIQIMYSFESKIKLNGFYVHEINNCQDVMLFEISNCDFVLKNSFFILNKQKSIQNSSNIDINFLANSNHAYLCRIKNVVFIGNQAFKQSSLLNFFAESINFKTQALISNSLFLFNNGNLGGSIFISNLTNSTILRNKFTKNKATFQIQDKKGKGGALYFLIQSQNLKIWITNNVFQQNSALIGGALYLNDPFNQVKITQNEFIENQAQFYGDDIASYINTLSFLNNQSIISFPEQTPQTIFVITGHNYSNPLLQIGAFDKFNNFLYQTDENYLLNVFIFENESFPPSNEFTFMQDEGSLILQGLIKRTSLPISSLFTYKIQFSFFEISSSIYFSLSFQDCDFGERLTDNFECVPCPVDTYIFETDFSTTSESCQSCLSRPFNCFGGGQIVPQQGFWRYNSSSSNFMQCFLESNCLGDNNLLNSTNPALGLITEEMMRGFCEQGYEGPLCSVCSQGYGKIDRYHCVSCQDSSYSVVLVLSTLVRVVFVITSVYYATQKCNAISSSSQNSIDKIFKSNLLKMMTNHMQVLIIIYSFPFQWSSQVNLFLQYFFSISPNVSDGFSLECFVQNNNLDVNSVYLKLEFVAIYPIILLVLSLVVLKAIKKFKKLVKYCKKRFSKKKKDVEMPEINIMVNRKSKIKISFMMKLVCVFAIILYNCYQDIMKFILQMFSCVEIGDPVVAKFSEKRLLIDLSIDCNATYHQKMLFGLVVPLVLGIGLFFPMLISFYLSKINKKGDLNRPENLYRLGYFYFSYKRPYYYWDFIILFRKTALLLIYCLFFSGKQGEDIYPIFIFLIILVISLFVHIEIKPFDVVNFNLLNLLEKYSLSSLSITIYLSLFLFTYMSNNEQYINQIFYAIMAIMAFSNGIFFYKWFRISFKHLIKPEMQTYIRKTGTFLNIIKNKLSKNSSLSSLVNITASSMENIEPDRNNTFGEKMRKVSFEILKQIKQKNEESKENLNSPNSSNRLMGNLNKPLSNIIIMEEDEEESPLKNKKTQKNSMRMEGLVIKSMESEPREENLDEENHKSPHLKENNMEIIDNDCVIEEEIDYERTLFTNLEDLNENIAKFEDFLKNYDENVKLNENIIFTEKINLVSLALFQDHKKYFENQDFSIEYETFAFNRKPLMIKVYIKAYTGQFQDFQIQFEETKNLYYKYDITYLSSQDSPSKNNGKSVVQGKIKEFFPLKDRIMIRFYIKIVSLNFFEIFHSLINFKLSNAINEKSFKISLDLPITLNKFATFLESQCQTIEGNTCFTIKIPKLELSNYTILEQSFPQCQVVENNEMIKFYGGLSFLGSFFMIREIFYELNYIKEGKAGELKMSYIDEQDKNFDFLLKKCCYDYMVLFNEWMISK